MLHTLPEKTTNPRMITSIDNYKTQLNLPASRAIVSAIPITQLQHSPKKNHTKSVIFSFAGAPNQNQSFLNKPIIKYNAIKSWKQKYNELFEQKESIQQSHDELNKLFESIQNELNLVKQENHQLKLQSFARASNVGQNANFEITTPKHSDVYPSECDEVLIIEDIINDIVSNDGIDSCNKKIKILLNVLSKLTILLNVIRKIIALFSTAFMIDCKLTGEGHFGIQCIDQIRVISVDNSFNKKPSIQLPGENWSTPIDWLDRIEQCLLPSCSCIHPSLLRYHSLKNPELYERCFYDQCKNPNNICINKPNSSQCQMRHRMCIDINDWCGKPAWYSLKLPPAQLAHPNHGRFRFQGRYFDVDAKPDYFKIEFETNCDDGRVCCRFILGPHTTIKDNDDTILTFLKQFCGGLHKAEMKKVNNWTPLDIVKSIEKARLISPGIFNRVSYIELLWSMGRAMVGQAFTLFDGNIIMKVCARHGLLKDCQNMVRTGDLTHNMVNEKFWNDILDLYLKYYNDNNLCLIF